MTSTFINGMMHSTYHPVMPRTSRAAIGGLVYHVLNRGNGRLEIFRKPGDFLTFCDLMVDAKERAEIEVFGFCPMSNH